MNVPPHPHTGLQTVSWLFDGEIEHRDSGGVHALVRPGELNLMTAGAGICHSEVSTSSTRVLHGVQLWVALPDTARNTDRDFAHHAPQAAQIEGATVRVFLGELAGVHSPVRTFPPLLGAQLDLAPARTSPYLSTLNSNTASCSTPAPSKWPVHHLTRAIWPTRARVQAA